MHADIYEAANDNAIEFGIGAMVALLISGIISDKWLKGKCFLTITIMNCLAILYQFIMIFMPHCDNSVGIFFITFSVGFLTDGVMFLYMVLCPLLIVNTIQPLP
jgi:sugar phosphate permease